MRDLAGAPCEAAAGVLARGQEADDVFGRGGRGGPALVPGKGGLQESEAVQDPVAQPRAAGIQGHEGRRELPEAAEDVLDVGVAAKGQRAPLGRHLLLELIPHPPVPSGDLHVEGVLLHDGLGHARGGSQTLRESRTAAVQAAQPASIGVQQDDDGWCFVSHARRIV